LPLVFAGRAAPAAPAPSKEERLHKKVYTSAAAPAPIGPYSQAIAAGGLLFVSGQVAIDPASGQIVPGDVSVQTEQVLKNLVAILREAKMGPENVVKTTVFLTDMGDFARMNEVYNRVFGGKEPPARSTVQVSGLPKGVNVEIDLIAAF
jgi:2-iminobutanoate/2-iminopropanoate deaminase